MGKSVGGAGGLGFSVMTHFESIRQRRARFAGPDLLSFGHGILPFYHERYLAQSSRRLSASSPMKRKSFEIILFSTVGVIAMFLVLVAVEFYRGTFQATSRPDAGEGLYAF